MYKLTVLDKVSIILVLIGALNWGIIGLLNFNLITIISLGMSLMQRTIYIIIFLATLNIISLFFRCGVYPRK